MSQKLPVTPAMLWQFRRMILGGKSAVTGAELPKALADCAVGVQEDHYAQACYVYASLVLTAQELLEQGASALLIVEMPKALDPVRATELRRKARDQALLDAGHYG
jgi:hypothetical protein